MVRKKKNNTMPNDALTSLELSKIGLTFAVIGDIIGYLSIIKGEEEAAELALRESTRNPAKSE